ncbi:glycosyltransferase family 4 protein [Maribacter sp. Asnod1-A12]|uniref:glycosyltransferase family 4 protein n=1 Tax=Maribacter sp. Asnod1-A12 TaxID=3160576 RepID=UPI00386FEB6C
MAIEYARLLSTNGYKMHLIIEMSPNQLKANILDIKANLEEYPALTTFNSVVKKWRLEYLSPYFENCVSVHFAVYPSNGILQTRSVAKSVQRYISTIGPDFIHLDDFSSRTLFFLSYFIKYRKKIVASIHDPLTHSGEFELQREVYRKIWFYLIPMFVVFSEFSKTILKPQLSKNKEITVLKLMPYTVYKSFLAQDVINKHQPKEYISFVGRISPYKGIDIFVEAAKTISKSFPEAKFLIGGKTARGYQLDFLSSSHDNITINHKFLSNSELSSIIIKSKLIVCPYKDATQSGVIMTSYALGCPVLVTPVGGLPEYVAHNINGMISEEVSAEAITASISDFLLKNRYQEMKKVLEENTLKEFEIYNIKKINKELYQ